MPWPPRPSVDPLDHLTSVDREALQLCVDSVPIPLASWPRVPWIRAWVEHRAIQTLADGLEGSSRRRAEDEAAGILGVDPGTYRRRLERARADAMDPTRGKISDNLSQTAARARC